MSSSLEGKQVVLAGGAGGLGIATAELLSSEGAEVVLSYRSRAPETGGPWRILRADVSNAGDRRALLDSLPQLYGLVVLAGDPARVKDPGELDAAMQRSWTYNYAGPVMLAREAAERMRANRTPGAIVLFSTMQAISVFPGSTAYAGAKAALINAARILAKECRGPVNIRVNVIAPGVMNAGMAKPSIAAGKYSRYLEEGTIPRYGAAEDAARAVRFFLEPDNYVTGQVLTVDGGLTL